LVACQAEPPGRVIPEPAQPIRTEREGGRKEGRKKINKIKIKILAWGGKGS